MISVKNVSIKDEKKKERKKKEKRIERVWKQRIDRILNADQMSLCFSKSIKRDRFDEWTKQM